MAKSKLEKLKLEVANETLGRDMKQKITPENYESVLERKKQEATEELGLSEKIDEAGWENMTTEEAGKVGGRVGGKIGGNMVKKLISMAEAQMAPVSDEAMEKSELTSKLEDG